jgi:phosphoesterase RecJ-like protein|tara:strand:- start:160 stop:1170 length:1011 start_codon:yes stop_codon:yes gene_type:complete
MTQNLAKSWDELTDLINKSKTILLSTHVNPDGDGLGSEIGFYYHLKNIGKECRIINVSPLPEIYECIDPDGVIETYSFDKNKWINQVDVTILFDIGDFKRINEIYPEIKNSKIVLFDHHPLQKENPYSVIVLDLGSPATGYMVWKYLQYLSIESYELDIISANALYAALITDTGSFRYGSTHSDAHLMAAHLLDSGVKPYEIHRAIYEQRKLSQVRLMSHVIQALQFSDDKKIAWFVINSEMLQLSGADLTDIDGFTEFVRTIKGVEVAFMIQQVAESTHRINFRSSGNYVINDVAKVFGGGGHIYAAGASVVGVPTKEIESQILKQLIKKINNGD